MYHRLPLQSALSMEFVVVSATVVAVVCGAFGMLTGVMKKFIVATFDGSP